MAAEKVMVQNLIYPAFLGAGIVNFTDSLLELARRPGGVGWDDLSWIASTLWFITYFCAAHGEAAKIGGGGLWRVILGVADSGCVYGACIAADALSGVDGASTWPSGDLRYAVIFGVWLLIPVIALVGKIGTSLEIRGKLSVMAMGCALAALLLAVVTRRPDTVLNFALAAMWPLLGCYLIVVFAPTSKWGRQLRDEGLRFSR